MFTRLTYLLTHSLTQLISTCLPTHLTHSLTRLTCSISAKGRSGSQLRGAMATALLNSVDTVNSEFLREQVVCVCVCVCMDIVVTYLLNEIELCVNG